MRQNTLKERLQSSMKVKGFVSLFVEENMDDTTQFQIALRRLERKCIVFGIA